MESVWAGTFLNKPSKHYCNVVYIETRHSSSKLSLFLKYFDFFHVFHRFIAVPPVWADFLEAEMKNVEGMAATCALKPVA